ncbi:MAG: hypothetical protein P8X57_03120 [Cyclobacteriaceae bacterium]
MMKTKYAILLFILGLAIDMTGALFKIMHWPSADIFLIIGTICQVDGLIIFGFKLLTHPKLKEFMNQ